MSFLKVYNNTVTSFTWKAARTKDSGTKKFATASNIPSPFSIKEGWVINWVRWLSWATLVHDLLGQLYFWIKLLFLTATACLWIYCSIVGWAGWAWSLWQNLHFYECPHFLCLFSIVLHSNLYPPNWFK